ncbi:MAG: DoxX family membrane protein, partial [Candidatus Marinimicrobia bacterium]|nr:DoxX family membrane protein [Candidatus Neomarinimicrobiota bacterium]
MTRYFKVQIVFFFRLIIGIIFIYASIDKISHPAEFAIAIGNYHAVPFGLENMIAMVLPWLELLVGVCLIAGIMVDGAAI